MRKKVKYKPFKKQGVNKLSRKKEVSPKKFYTDKKIGKLEQNLRDMKSVLAQIFLQADRKSLQKVVNCGSVKNDPLQVQARNEIRETCQSYAEYRANDLNVTDMDKRGIFFDLTYNALYTQYKKLTNTDLKTLADQKSKETGLKVSALQVAEENGLAVDLLELAHKLFKI